MSIQISPALGNFLEDAENEKLKWYSNILDSGFFEILK